MPASEAKSPVVGIFVSDLHFSENPPAARACEVNWMKVQADRVFELRKLQQTHKAPILIPGDVFDKWDAKPYIIGSVLNWIRGMDIHTIAGNHDMPNHCNEQLPRSAYWTLVEAGAIKHLVAGFPQAVGEMIVYPFPYGYKVSGVERKNPDVCLHVALIHSYIWTAKTGHEGADPASRVGKWFKNLNGYDIAVFGDNHSGFLYLPKGYHSLTIKAMFNCGTFLRRKIDEKGYRPRAGLLHSNGTMTQHFFDCSKDKFMETSEELKSLESALELDLSSYVREMNDLHAERMDFAKVCLRAMEKEKVSLDLRTLICRVLGVKYGKR